MGCYSARTSSRPAKLEGTPRDGAHLVGILSLHDLCSLCIGILSLHDLLAPLTAMRSVDSPWGLSFAYEEQL